MIVMWVLLELLVVYFEDSKYKSFGKWKIQVRILADELGDER